MILMQKEENIKCSPLFWFILQFQIRLLIGNVYLAVLCRNQQCLNLTGMGDNQGGLHGECHVHHTAFRKNPLRWLPMPHHRTAL